jgi:hypothetical protein
VRASAVEDRETRHLRGMPLPAGVRSFSSGSVRAAATLALNRHVERVFEPSSIII